MSRKEDITKNILIGVVILLLVLEALALALSDIPVISSVVASYRLKVFSVPFGVSMLASHFWITLFTKKWWNPLVWGTMTAIVLYVDFYTNWEPSNSGLIVLLGLLTGLFWSQKKEA